MTHLRPDARGRHKLSQCRKGRHRYGPPQHIGAGLERQVCDVCNAVSIDLTKAEGTDSPVLTRRPKISHFTS